MTRTTERGRSEPLAEVVEDEVAFRRWYDHAMPRVYRFLLTRCNHDVALAEELTQQTFVEAVRRRHQFDGRSDSVTWLIAIGRNKLIDHHRRLDRERRRHLKLVAGWSGSSDASVRAPEEREAIESALGQLGGEQRVALLLRHLDGLSIREIATLIGRTESATDSLLFRAREAFRRAYRGTTDA